VLTSWPGDAFLSSARRSRCEGRDETPVGSSQSSHLGLMKTANSIIPASPGLERRSYGDVVDLSFNGETERAQLREPRIAILVGNEGEDADHPGFEVASDTRPSALVSPVDDISRSVHSGIHVSFIMEAGCGDANFNLPCHVALSRHVSALTTADRTLTSTQFARAGGCSLPTVCSLDQSVPIVFELTPSDRT
jgi:hypothetical protein